MAAIRETSWSVPVFQWTNPTCEGCVSDGFRRVECGECGADGLRKFSQRCSGDFHAAALRGKQVGLRGVADAVEEDVVVSREAAQVDGVAARGALAGRSKRLEAKADRLTVQAREICARLQDGEGLRRLVDAVEDAMDAMDEGAFLISLGSTQALPRSAELSRLATIVVQSIGAMVRALEAASRLPDGRRADAVAALQSVDEASQAEREADCAERAALGALMQISHADARTLVLGIEVARALEGVTDHVAHAALALRGRVLEELSA